MRCGPTWLVCFGASCQSRRCQESRAMTREKVFLFVLARRRADQDRLTAGVCVWQSFPEAPRVTARQCSRRRVRYLLSIADFGEQLLSFSPHGLSAPSLKRVVRLMTSGKPRAGTPTTLNP